MYCFRCSPSRGPTNAHISPRPPNWCDVGFRLQHLEQPHKHSIVKQGLCFSQSQYLPNSPLPIPLRTQPLRIPPDPLPKPLHLLPPQLTPIPLRQELHLPNTLERTIPLQGDINSSLKLRSSQHPPLRPSRAGEPIKRHPGPLLHQHIPIRLAQQRHDFSGGACSFAVATS